MARRMLKQAAAAVLPTMLLLAVLSLSAEASIVGPRKSTSPFVVPPSRSISSSSSWRSIPRGGSDATAAEGTVEKPSSSGNGNVVTDSLSGLSSSLRGIKSDSLLLLAVTAFVPALCDAVGASPILGFLASGVLFGPNGRRFVADPHGAEAIADLGVVLFLFEMGIHLDFETLMAMRADVFGLGLSQFLVTALVVGIAALKLGMSGAASVVLGGGLALSSSAFVLQLLKDGDQLNTEYGKTSFGVLLLQDLAVVPLLVATPILAGNSGGGVGEALKTAAVQAAMALGAIAAFGKFLLTPLFDRVAACGSRDAYIGLLLGTVLGMSFLTEGLGLSNTLGAFLAGVLLSETSHRHRVEEEISPFRGILVGLFFFTVGFEIDLNLIASKPLLVASIVIAVLIAKALIAGSLALAFGKGLPTAQRAGLVLSQGGEFAFLAFRLAREVGILSVDVTKMMLTCVSLTMAATPFLEGLGAKVAERLEGKEKEKVQ